MKTERDEPEAGGDIFIEYNAEDMGFLSIKSHRSLGWEASLLGGIMVSEQISIHRQTAQSQFSTATPCGSEN